MLYCIQEWLFGWELWNRYYHRGSVYKRTDLPDEIYPQHLSRLRTPENAVVRKIAGIHIRFYMALRLNTAFRRSSIGNLGQTGYLALIAPHSLWRQATRYWYALDDIIDPEITDSDTRNLRLAHIKQHRVLLDLHLVGWNVLLVLWGQYLLRILHGQDKLLTQPFCLAMCCLTKRLVTAFCRFAPSKEALLLDSSTSPTSAPPTSR